MKCLTDLRTTSNEMLTLDALRFIAAGSIVLLHSVAYFYPVDDRATAMVRWNGLALFVDLFFLISGYVIAFVYLDRVQDARSILDFVRRRIGRLYPLHLLTFLLAIVMWLVIGRFYRAPGTPSFEPSCIARTALLLHALIPCDRPIYFNGVNWSIAAEMVLYLLFPLMAPVVRRSPRGFLAATLLLAVSLLILRAPAPREIASWTTFLDPLRALPAFCLGVAARANRRMLDAIPFPNALVLFALFATLFAVRWPVSDNLAAPLFYILGIAAMAADSQGDSSRLAARLAPLGQLTYSIYLWHPFFIMICLNAIAEKALHRSQTGLAAMTTVMISSILAWSYISWRYFENPARRRIDAL